jgi:ammonium transporter, Amt family
MSYTWVGAPATFNGTDPLTGGDSSKSKRLPPFSIPILTSILSTATTNLNQWYQSGDQAFIIVASCMVLLMIPGLGFLYSGLARRKSALSMIWACMGSFSVIVFQWYFWGYSLAFSNTGTSGFIGDLAHFGLMNTLGEPSPGSPLLPELLYSFYQVCIPADCHIQSTNNAQLQFCATTAAIVVGAVAERGRLIPAMVFIFGMCSPRIYFYFNHFND